MWSPDINFPAPPGGSGFGHVFALNSNWFAATDHVSPGGTSGGEVRLHVWERGRVSPGVWSALPPVIFPRTFGFNSAVAIDESWLVVATGNLGPGLIALRLYELPPGGIGGFPREVWRTLVPASEVLRQVLLSGRNLAVAHSADNVPNSGSVVRVFEARNDSRTHWVPVHTKTGFHWPALLDGDRLVIGSPGSLNTFEKHAGGPNNWGLTFSGPGRGDDYFAAPELRGNVLFIGESALPGGAPAAGQVKTFVRDPTGGGWVPAGSFSPPPPATELFGFDVSVSGLDVGVTSAGGNPAWAGTFPGGRGIIRDDDLPAVRLSPSVACEPRGGTESAWVQVALTRTAAAPVIVGWETRAQTATPGLDYVTSSGTLIIPVGEWQGSIRVPLLADSVVETDESVVVRIIPDSLSGATLAAEAAELVIRDTEVLTPVLAVTADEAYEGAAPVRWTMEAWPFGEALAVPWGTDCIHRNGGGQEGMAIVNADFTPATGSFHPAGTRASQSGVVDIHDDEVTEGREEFSLIIEPPVGAIAASWAQRLIHPLESNPLTSSDGDWVAVTDAKSSGGAIERGDVVLFRRSPAAPGGWVEELRRRASDFGGTTWDITWLALRNGSLVLWDSAGGEFFFFGANEGGPGQWGLEIRLRAVPGLGGMAFDGRTLLTVEPGNGSGKLNVVEAIERDAFGKWTLRRELDTAGFSFSPISVGIDGNVAALAGQSATGSRGMVRILELEAGSIGRWRKVSDALVTTPSLTTADAVKVNRGLVAVSALELATSSIRLYRRGLGGGWSLEQTLATSGLAALERGLVLANREVWARTAAGPTPWKKVATLPAVWERPDVCRGVLTGWQQIPSGASSVPAAFIAEPGAPGVIIDDESVSYVLTGAREATEEPGTVTRLRFGLRFSPGIQIPVEVPWQTADGTALAGADYVAAGGVVQIPPDGTGYVSIPILPDALPEGTEQFKIGFGKPSFGSPASWEVSATIYNRNVPVTLPAGPIVFPEPAGGEATFIVPVKLPYPLPDSITCNCEVRAGTADAADALLGTFPVAVPAGSPVLLIPLTLLADDIVESTEALNIRPGFPAGFTLQGATGIPVHVADADVSGFTALNYSAAEGTILSQAAPGVLSGNTGGYRRARIVHAPSHGTVTLNPDGAFTYTPAPNFVGQDRFTFQAIQSAADLVSPGTVTTWRWRHPLNGQDPELSLPGFQANWKTSGFNDASWAAGSGLMGYGLIGPAPGINLNTIIGTPPSGQRYTAYFRHSFQAPANSPPSLTLELLCDDAAVFYLNGAEAGRFAIAPSGNFAAAPDTYTLLCQTAANDADEPVVRSVALTENVTEGPNLLAVSLHNQSNSSSDLGFRLHSMTTGTWSEAVTATVTVSDAMRPPLLAPDSFDFPAFVPAADTRLLPSGGLFENDGLFADDGTMPDPVLEVAIGGTPAGPVSADPATGHFRIALPPYFFGSTDFTYRVRDKDGWSQPASVSVTVSPSAPLQTWQQLHFGLSSHPMTAGPLADPDGDGMPNLLEFVGNADPLTAGFDGLLAVSIEDGQVELNFRTLAVSGTPADDVLISAEASDALENSVWQPLAKFSTQFSPIEMNAGIEHTATDYEAGTLWTRRLRIGPPGPTTRFFRLRAAVLPPWWRY
jgi:hypothetical protein